MSSWRIVFMGTPDFALPCLEVLLSGSDTLVGVFTQPDKPVGRGLKLAPPPVKRALLAHIRDSAVEEGIGIFQPVRLRATEAVADLRQLKPDLLVVVAYGQILSPEVLAIPRHGCVNVHASLLPRWRGAAPIQRALLAGDLESGVTLMQMEAGLDTGPILSQRVLSLAADLTGGELHDQLAQLGAQLLQETIPLLQSGTLHAQPQPAEAVTYAAKLTKLDEQIDWYCSAHLIRQKILALNPWPAAHTWLRGKPLKIFRCRLGNSDGEAGHVIALREDGPEVACTQGSLILTEVQLAGKRRMLATDWLRGSTLSLGERLDV